MKYLIIVAIVFAQSLVFADTGRRVVGKAIQVSDLVYDKVDLLTDQQKIEILSLFEKIEAILSGNDFCSDKAQSYQQAYEWAYKQWSSQSSAKAFANDVSALCHGDLYLASYVQSYAWAYKTWSSQSSAKDFAGSVAAYEAENVKVFECYVSAYEWAYKQWSSQSASKEHAQKLCLPQSN